MSEPELERLRDGLQSRLKMEKRKADVLAAEVEHQAEVYEWEMRVDDTAAEGEEEEQGQEEEDDLFGEGDEEEEAVGPNPREGWSLVDYVSFIDTGKKPIIRA